jgi:hypothetical protein
MRRSKFQFKARVQYCDRLASGAIKEAIKWSREYKNAYCFCERIMHKHVFEWANSISGNKFCAQKCWCVTGGELEAGGQAIKATVVYFQW